MDTDGLALLYERIAERMWRSMGWACDEKSNAVINCLKKSFGGRSTRWRHSLQTEMMERVQEVAQDGSICGDGTSVEMCG